MGTIGPTGIAFRPLRPSDAILFRDIGHPHARCLARQPCATVELRRARLLEKTNCRSNSRIAHCSWAIGIPETGHRTAVVGARTNLFALGIFRWTKATQRVARHAQVDTILVLELIARRTCTRCQSTDIAERTVNAHRILLNANVRLPHAEAVRRRATGGVTLLPMTKVPDVFARSSELVEHADFSTVALGIGDARLTQSRTMLLIHRAAAFQAVANEWRARILAACGKLRACTLHASSGIAHALAGNVRALGVLGAGRARSRIAG